MINSNQEYSQHYQRKNHLDKSICLYLLLTESLIHPWKSPQVKMVQILQKYLKIWCMVKQHFLPREIWHRQLIKNPSYFSQLILFVYFLKFSWPKLTRTVKSVSLWFAIIFPVHHSVNIKPFSGNKLFFKSNYFQCIVSFKKKKKTFIKDLDFLKVLFKKKIEVTWS